MAAFKDELTARSKYFKACKDCTRRFDMCHSGCEEYAKEVILGILLEADARRNNAKRDDEYAISANRARRVAKVNPSCKKYANKMIKAR